MGFLRLYGKWIGLCVALVVVLALRFTYLSGLYQAETEVSEELKNKLNQAEAWANKAGKTDPNPDKAIPSMGDIKKARQQDKDIEEQGLQVQKLWRDLTDSLNYCMSCGRREGGEIVDPASLGEDGKGGKVVPWSIFSVKVDELYKKAFQDLEDNLKRQMEPAFEQMKIDDLYASSDDMTLEKVKEFVKQQAMAEKLAEARSRIIYDKAAVNAISVDDRYDENNKHEAWLQWRKYLITRDILARVVPNSSVELRRDLNAAGNVGDDAAREARRVKKENKEKLDSLQPKLWPDRLDMKFVERVKSLVVDRVDVGNKSCPAIYFKKEEPKDKAKEKQKDKDTKENRRRFGKNVEPEPDKYYDEFTVEIVLDAHISVIRKFQREILQSENMFYTPVSFSVKRLEDVKVMGKSESPIPVVIPVVAQPQEYVGYSHEPYVEATFKYKILRFRYEDTDNPDRSLLLEKNRNNN